MAESERAARVMLGHLDDPEVPIRGLLSDLLGKRHRQLSDGERVVVGLAMQFWNGYDSTPFGDALKWLDEENLANFVRALAIVRPDVVALVARELP